MNPSSPDPARARFAILMAVRFSAVLMVMGGMLIASDRFPAIAPPVSQWLGYTMMALGFLELVLVVPMLHRRWRSPRDGDAQ
jgi:membrane protein implicated in regulation of membrane protease activity